MDDQLQHLFTGSATPVSDGNSMTITVWKLPCHKTQQVPKEVKRVKILTGKHKGKVRDFCHFLGEDKVVVHVDVCKYITYKCSSVEFVESDTILVTEFY